MALYKDVFCWSTRVDISILVLQLTAAVMTMGELKFKQKGREEQCEPDKNGTASKVRWWRWRWAVGVVLEVEVEVSP